MRSTATLAAAAAGVATFDLVSKHLVFQKMGTGGQVEVIPGFFALKTIMNEGGLFGVGQGRNWLFILFSIVAIVVILWIFFSLEHISGSLRLALGFVLGGALGNLWDRVMYKAVRDFLDVYIASPHSVRDFLDACVGSHHWPTFNVADAFICVGAAILVWQIWRMPDGRAKQSDQRASDAASS